MTRILFLISFFLMSCGSAMATETISRNPIGGEVIKDFKSSESLTTINEELRLLRQVVKDLDQRLKAGSL